MSKINFDKPVFCKGNVSENGDQTKTSCSSSGCNGPTVLAVYENGNGSGANGSKPQLSAICCKEAVSLPKDVALVHIRRGRNGGAWVTAASIRLTPEQIVQRVPGALGKPDTSVEVQVLTADRKRVWPK